MPYKIVHHQHSSLVSLINRNTGHIYAKSTTLTNANKQIQAIELHKKMKIKKFKKNKIFQ
jgi:hypothetical protein